MQAAHRTRLLAAPRCDCLRHVWAAALVGMDVEAGVGVVAQPLRLPAATGAGGSGTNKGLRARSNGTGCSGAPAGSASCSRWAGVGFIPPRGVALPCVPLCHASAARARGGSLHMNEYERVRAALHSRQRRRVAAAASQVEHRHACSLLDSPPPSCQAVCKAPGEGLQRAGQRLAPWAAVLVLNHSGKSYKRRPMRPAWKWCPTAAENHERAMNRASPAGMHLRLHCD